MSVGLKNHERRRACVQAHGVFWSDTAERPVPCFYCGCDGRPAPGGLAAATLTYRLNLREHAQYIFRVHARRGVSV